MIQQMAKQVIPMVIAGIITALVLERLRNPPPPPTPPIADDENKKHWWEQ